MWVVGLAGWLAGWWVTVGNGLLGKAPQECGDGGAW